MSERNETGRIDSAIGSVNLKRRTQERVITVEDTSLPASSLETERQRGLTQQIQSEEDNNYKLDQVRELEAQLEIAKREKAAGQRAPAPAKNRLEILLGIARLSEDIVVDGVTFSIRSLKGKESKEVIDAVLEIKNSAIQAFEMRDQTLVRSLFAIDGHDVDYIINSKSLDDKLKFVQELDDSLVNHLYNRYTELVTQNNKRFQDLGKTEEEIVENVKKS